MSRCPHRGLRSDAPLTPSRSGQWRTDQLEQVHSRCSGWRPFRPAGFTPARPYQSECAAGGRYGALETALECSVTAFVGPRPVLAAGGGVDRSLNVSPGIRPRPGPNPRPRQSTRNPQKTRLAAQDRRGGGIYTPWKQATRPLGPRRGPWAAASALRRRHLSRFKRVISWRDNGALTTAGPTFQQPERPPGVWFT